jgi:hypothetical protein
VANSYLKATRIAAASLGLLEREIILPALVWRDAGGDFAGAFGDTISLRVPARTTARTRTFRGARPTASEGQGVIVMDELTETKVDVSLDTAPYSAVAITDEELTLDIVNFGEQVLRPQVRAVAEAVENAVAAEMVGATYPTGHSVTLDTTEPYNSVVDARVALNKANVPMTDRYIVVGADMEGVFLKSEHLNRVDASGTDSMLRQATIGRLAGFEAVIVSNALPANVGFAFHKTAYVLSMRAPAVPDGATFGSSRSFEGLAMRWIRDYDFRNVQDRSLIDTYIGTNIVADGAGTNEVQTVTITGTPTGGTFTLTYQGNTTSAIAYNANAAAVQTALRALPNTQNVTVGGGPGPGTPYTVTFGDGTDVTQMSASGSFTGGSSPAVAVSTTTAGGGNSFVRAVKFTM